MVDNKAEAAKTLVNKITSYGWKSAAVAGVAIVVLNSYGYNNGGVATRVQQPVMGHKWIKEEGYFFKVPFLSRTKEFNKTGTISATDNPKLIKASGIHVAPMVAPFADAYEMRFEWSMRYQIPLSDENLESMYQDLKSQENMLANTLMPFGQTMFTDTVNQMLGADFAQGGKNTLRSLVDNQSQYGMYQTKVKTIKIDRGTGTGSNSVLGGAQTDLEITKVTYVTGEDGKRVRTPISIAAYGLKIVPNSFQIIDNKAQGRLVDFIQTKQDNQRALLAQDSRQKTLAKEAQTAQLEGEKSLVQRTNELNIQKQERIIAMEQKVEEARLQAEKETVEREKVASLAIIDKERELQIAKANEGIQKANSQAAKYEAQAIVEVGLANAKVKKADYAAIDKEILISNNNRDVALSMYESNMTINMPNYLNVGGEAANQTSVENMSTIKFMEQMQINTAK